MRTARALLASLILLIALTGSAHAEQMTISAQTLPWSYSTSGTSQLSFELDQDGIDASGVPRARGTGPKITLPAPVYNATKGYYEVTIPQFFIESTQDWIRPSGARYNAFFIVAGRRIPWTDFQNMAVPSVFPNVGTPLVGTFSQLSTFNKNFAPIIAHDGYTKQEIDRRFSALTLATGTLTSVSLSVPSALFNSSVTGSPVTSSGTLAPTLATQSANVIFAGPSSGSAGTPTFRSLVVADIPSITASKISDFNAAFDTRFGNSSVGNLSDVMSMSPVANDLFFYDGTASKWKNRALAGADLTAAGGVLATRLISAGTGLSGGGDLSSNRTLSVTADSTTQRVEVYQNGSSVGTRKTLNFIEGANITLTAADNSGSNRTDITIATTGLTNPMTTAGDLIVGASAGAPSRLPIGSNGFVLKVSAGTPVWTAEGGGTSHDLLSPTHTDTTAAAVSRGALIVGGASTWTKLPIGSAGKALASDGVDAAWTSLAASNISDFSAAADARIAAAALDALSNVTVPAPSNGDALFYNGSAWVNLPISVAISTPSWLTVAGSPITRTGTLALTATSQTANTVLAGPTTGAAAASAFRTLVVADIPTLTASKISDFDAQVFADVANGTGLNKTAVGSTVVLSLTNPGGAGTWTKVTVDSTGRVSSGTTLSASDLNEIMALNGLSDVTITSPSSGQTLSYNGSAWVNAVPATAPVTSVFGRTGAVVAASADYTAAQVTNAASVVAANTFSALNKFDFSNGSDFSGADSTAYHPYQNTPTRSAVAIKGTYNVDGAGNIFELSSMVETAGSEPAVAIFGAGVAKGTKSSFGSRTQAWGGNFTGSTDVNGSIFATAISTEINFGALGTSANQDAYGAVIGAVGTGSTPAGANRAYIQMQVSTPSFVNSRPTNGINFVTASGVAPVTGALISSSGVTATYGWDMTTGAYTYGIDAGSSTFSAGVLRLPNNQRGIIGQNALNTGSINLLKVDASNYLRLGDDDATFGAEQIRLDVKGLANAVQLSPTLLTVATPATFSSTLDATGATTLNSTLAVTGAGTFTGATSFDGAATFKHVLVTGTAPTLGTWAAGAGTTTPGTASVTGSDTAGKITFTTTASPALDTDIVTVSFNVAYGNAPFVIIQPDKAAANAATVAVSSVTTAGFTLHSAATNALTASTAYGFYYHVIGR